MLATAILYLREGLEASLIVSILLAALRQLQLMRQVRAVWIGVALAVLCSFLAALTLYVTVRIYDGTWFEAAFETVTYLLAVVLLTSMTFWMQHHSRTLKREMMTKASMASSGLALGLLAFTSVAREGLETAFFTLAFALQTHEAPLLMLGALFGLALALALCFLIYRLGYRLDYRLFFRIMGLLLLFFAAGLLGNAIQTMQEELHWIPFGTAVLWDSSGWLSEESAIGSLLHSLLGYSDAPTQLQAFIYGVFLLVFGVLFWRATRKPVPLRSAESSPTLPSEAATGGTSQ
ncbi:FTR1 family iron permease [Thermogemmatispora sp.]|uniref:FTR1 family iron permease n=1 Tax=Thermogemmatispora sp. TaxID=1968838 RepID=UPI001D32BEFE|nr:FTR1 family protein [Thermogemmatispora sp.]MBX5449535.1 FTR1 family protein [Thermogemmatispora sp.]